MRIKNIVSVVLVALLLVVFNAALVWAEARFFSVLPDVPIAHGFNEMTDSIMMFDKPEGRLVDFSAESSSQLSCQGAISFYVQALPHLGWQEASSGAFLREGERLDIRLEQQNANLCVLNFSLRPE